MNEINKTNLSEQTKFRLSEIIGIENYFHQEINQRKSCSKKLSKYVTAFDYIDKILIVLSATSSGVCIISSASVAGALVGIASASFTLFFLTTGIIKKLLSITRNKKKKHDKIFVLVKSKLDSIENLVSQALIDMEISQEEFNAVIRDKQKYERMKENVKNVSENIRLNSVNSKKIMPYIIDITFLTSHFKHFDFIEWSDLNSNTKNIFERSSINLQWIFRVAF